jgi:CubicO group peptidase (beta-lactamase class C family)
MTKFKVSSLLVSLVFLIGIAANIQAETLPAQASQEELPLRLSEPVEAIVADLKSYIPEYMREQNIPGVGIALIRDGEVVWTDGFGVANVLTRKAVTPDTVFEVASNSKVVTAYIALRLVDHGLLSLDEPLNSYLPEPWLPASEYKDIITMRHVLSHTSGLSHLSTSRDSLFAPGLGYSYSAIGFQYLQAVIEQVTGQSLEEVAQEMVFTPLGMSFSSFVNPPELISNTANGHLRAIVPVLIFAILYAVFLVIVGFIGLVILRMRTGQWRPNRRMVVGILAGAFVLSLLAAFILITGTLGWPEFAWLVAFCALALAIAFTAAFLAGRAIIIRLIPNQPRQQSLMTLVWTMLTLVALVFLAGWLTNLPVPKWPQTEENAGGSMRATAGDMATFLIELSNPQHLNVDMAAELQKPQVRLAEDLAWGLGPGIQSSPEGDALWQWGQHVDFQSIMIIYPEHGLGVVVLTNNDLLNPDVAIEIAHRALGGEVDPILRATRLEFNYRERDE